MLRITVFPPKSPHIRKYFFSLPTKTNNVGPMNRVIQFFSYEQCFKHYTKQVISIRQAKIHGEIIVAKPVMLLAIIDGVEANVFMNNKFVLNDWLEEQYKKLMEQFTKSSQFDGTTGIEKPFWHLESDGFWHFSGVYWNK